MASTEAKPLLQVPQIYHPAVSPGLLEPTKLAELISWRSAYLSAQESTLDDFDREFLNEPSTLYRYIVAKKNDVSEAVKGILETMAWRKTAINRPFRCEPCISDHKSHCFFPICVSQPELPEELTHPARTEEHHHSHGSHSHSHSHSHGHGDAAPAAAPLVAPLERKPLRRAVLYSCQPRAGDSGVEAQVNHVVHTIEQIYSNEGRGLKAYLEADDTGSKGGDSDVEIDHRFTWLVDMAGFGFSHAMQGRVGISTIGTLSKHLPERLHSLVLINAPSVFDLFLKAVKPFVDARTLGKVKTIHAKPGEELIKRLMAPDLALTREAAEFVSAANALKGVPGDLPPIMDSARTMMMPCVRGYYPSATTSSSASPTSRAIS